MRARVCVRVRVRVCVHVRVCSYCVWVCGGVGVGATPSHAWPWRPVCRGVGRVCVREGVRGGSRLVARVKQVVPAAGLLPPSHWLTCRWARVGSIFALSGHCAVHRVVRVCVPRSHRSCSCLAVTRRRGLRLCSRHGVPGRAKWQWQCGGGGGGGVGTAALQGRTGSRQRVGSLSTPPGQRT